MSGRANRSGAGDGAATLPINLLLKGRLCLFIGAGQVAYRKISTVLERGGRVLVVAPAVCHDIRRLARAGSLTIREEPYRKGVLAELMPFLVFAATDDDSLNQEVMTEAARLGVLATAASSWRHGDFISPSVLRWSKGQVSISTDGASCRQAKFMRRRLGDLLGGEREFLVIGVDLRQVSLSELERVRPSNEELSSVIAMLRQLAALEEFAILVTCNRVELYGYTRNDPELIEAVVRIMGWGAVRQKLYLLLGENVVEHASNVVAGHYSQVVCETQITAQFKAAFEVAFAKGVAGALLQTFHDRVLRIGKQLRALHGASQLGLPELVAKVVAARLPVSGNRVLLLGAGVLAKEVAARLAEIDGLSLTWANRTVAAIPTRPSARRLELGQALGLLGCHDQVVCALGASRPVILAEHLERCSTRPLLIDLGLPRNVAPGIREGEAAEVVDLGDFGEHGVDRTRLLELAHTVARGRLAVGHA